MIDLDRWREIAETVARNPLRSLLTMGAVAWGTFVLVVLLGAGQGLENAVRWQFRDDATNSVWVYRGKTSRPHLGNPVGRTITLTSDDYSVIDQRIDGVERISARFYLRGESTVAYGQRVAGYSVRGVHPDHQFLEKTLMLQGRYIDPLDVSERRKVSVLGRKVAEYLFRDSPPVGAYVQLSGVPFLVVGVFDDAGEEGEVERIYIPITTAQAVFGGNDEINQIMFTLPNATPESAVATVDAVRELLAARHHFDPRDMQAIRVRSNVEEFARFQSIVGMLRAFVWMIGAGTLAAGFVGVGNIMVVAVGERTAEIALRKAVGATPMSVVRDVVVEATVLTAVSGYAGIVLGVVALVAMRSWLPPSDYLRDPAIPLGPAILAAMALTVSGAVIGLIPAWMAARLSPATGMRPR